MGAPTTFRDLQTHLDRLAVGFPAAASGADLRLLQQLFTAEEAQLALHLTNEPASLDEVASRAGDRFPRAQVGALLDDLTQRGVIGRREAGEQPRWHLLPLCNGMFETRHDGIPDLVFAQTSMEYFGTSMFVAAYQTSQPPQMRVVPVNQSIPVQHHVATHDDLRATIAASPGPFAVMPCLCRELQSAQGHQCARTARRETCLVLGDMAAGVLRRGHGRKVTREELLALVRQSEQDGLVLQPSNAQDPEMVCCCCSCCCGFLAFQRMVPRPAREWGSTYHADVDAEICSLCAECESRCQLDAITVPVGAATAEVDLDRCLGCGLCVPACPMDALRLVPNTDPATPPRDVDQLLRMSAAHRAAS